MPEMPSIPILPSARLSASSSSVSATSSGPSGAAGVANGDAASAAGSPGHDASLPDDGGSGSFASILKRQLAQSEPAESANAQSKVRALVSEISLLPGATMPVDLLAKLPIDATLTADPGLRQPLTMADARLISELTPQSKLDNAALSELGADPAAAATEAAKGAGIALADELNVVQPLGNVSVPTLANNALQEAVPASDPSSRKEDDLTQQDSPANSLAALLAFFPAMAPAVIATPAPKADATLPEAGQNPSDTAGNPQLLMASVSTLIQTALGKQEGAPSSTLTETALLPGSKAANIAETSLLPNSKTADFAASLAVTADAAPVLLNRNEGLSAEASFENMLAAAQVSGHGRTVDSQAPTQAAARIEVQTPVGTRGWENDVGDKLVWMVGRQEQRAELVLNPPQLGRVEVSLTMNGDQTNASFVSANPAVRDALEAALPRLREMLADAGVSLGQTQVGAESSNNAANQSANNRENGDNSSRYSNSSDQALDANMLRQTDGSQWLKQGRGLVDTFA